MSELTSAEMRQVQGGRGPGCTGEACNGGNAGILFGDGGDGATSTPIKVYLCPSDPR